MENEWVNEREKPGKIEKLINKEKIVELNDVSETYQYCGANESMLMWFFFLVCCFVLISCNVNLTFSPYYSGKKSSVAWIWSEL